MDTPTEEGPETFRVNVPASEAPKLADAPDEGHCLVKYKKDGDAYCLDLSSLRPGGEVEPDADDDMPEEDLPTDEYMMKGAKELGVETE